MNEHTIIQKHHLKQEIKLIVQESKHIDRKSFNFFLQTKNYPLMLVDSINFLLKIHRTQILNQLCLVNCLQQKSKEREYSNRIMYSAKKQYKPVNHKAIIPLTIYQINHDLKDEVIFENQQFHTVSIVARLENCERQNNFNMFKFCDGTGKIQGRINLTGGKMPAFAEGMNFQANLNNYYFVVLKPRIADQERKFYIQMIRPVTNHNMIAKHFSDVILSSLIRRKH